MEHCQIAIAGGGIAGLTIAIAFRKAGYDPVVFEAAPTLLPVGAGLGLAANAIHALDKLGIKEKVISRGRLLPSFSIKDEKGRNIAYTDSKLMSSQYGLDNFTIHRAALHEVLMAEIPANRLITGKRCLDLFIDANTGHHHLSFQDGSVCSADHVVVADGVHSALRQLLVPGSTPRYAGYTCWRAVIDNRRLQIKDTYEIWGSKGRFGLVPLADDQLYWFATVNAPQHDPKFKIFQVSDLSYWFKQYPEEVYNVLQATPERSLIAGDIIDIQPIPQYAFGKLLLTGDAAHATTPNMGQGACQAMEDAAVLYDELLKGDPLEKVFLQFEKRRIPRTHFIINQSERIGKLAQLTHPLSINLRNTAFRLLPSFVKRRQIRKVYQTDF